MAFKLDDELLEELGLAALPPQEKQTMLRQILETLEMRVGTTLASRMSDAQLDEFERLMPAEGDDQTIVQQKEQQALKWLETNFPNYKQVVNDELEKLKVEIKQSAPQILSASQQNSSAMANPTAPYQVPPMAGQQASQVPPQVPTYAQAPAAAAPYAPPAQPAMPAPPMPPMQPQPGFSTPPPQYSPQPSVNPTLQQPQPTYNPPAQPPQTFTPPPSPFQPPADNNGYSQPPYPPQQPYQPVQ